MTKLRVSHTSRLSPIADYYGKTRVVAIGDYFSQRALKPFANYLFNLLSKLKGDCTYNQFKASKEIRSRIKGGNKS